MVQKPYLAKIVVSASPQGTWLISVKGTPVARLLIITEGKRMTLHRHRFKQNQSLEERLASEAKQLREQAALLPPGALREEVLRKARQAETGSRRSEWWRSHGLRPSE